MNICFFNLQEPSGTAMRGGTERATSLLAKELRQRGHCVEFCSFRPSRCVHTPIIYSILKYFAGVRFRQFLKERKIDVAVWHAFGRHFPFPLKNLPCRLITVLHNTPTLSEQACVGKVVKKWGIRSRLGQLIFRSESCRSLIWKFYEGFQARSFFSYVLNSSDKLVLLSERFFSEFAQWRKFPQKVCAIPNIAPFEVQNVSFDEKKKELLWLGRMDFAQKRPDFMLQIWQRLQDRFPHWSLRFVGDGPYLPKLKALAKELGVQRVFFEGHQDPTPYYRSAPIYCMTSTFEGLPMTLLEAQAFGCVPITFESYSSVRDIIEDGANSYLIPPFDLDIYAEKLAQLMQDSTLRERLAENGQKSIVKFSPEAVGDKWEKLLREVQDTQKG